MSDVKELERIRKGLQENGYVIHATYKEKYKEFCVLVYHPKLVIEAWGFDENELAAYKEVLNAIGLSSSSRDEK